MSNWIKSYQALGEHPKLKKLARLLDISENEAIGILHRLWWWSVDYCPDGDLTDIDRGVIADGCAWKGDADVLIEALADATVKQGGYGFLENGDGLRIHDHYEHIGRHLEAQAADAERKRAARRSPTVHKTSTRRPQDSDRTADVDRKIDRKIERKRAGACDATAPPARSQPVDNSGGILCYRCGAEIVDEAVESPQGLRHKRCKAAAP